MLIDKLIYYYNLILYNNVDNYNKYFFNYDIVNNLFNINYFNKLIYKLLIMNY